MDGFQGACYSLLNLQGGIFVEDTVLIIFQECFHLPGVVLSVQDDSGPALICREKDNALIFSELSEGTLLVKG